MTITEKSSRKVILGPGWGNPLTHDFMIENASYAHVFADGYELVQGVDYTVSNVNDPSGYVVTIAVPGTWVNIAKWILDARPPIAQGKDLTVGGQFGIKYEDATDQLARRLQRVYDFARRAVKVPISTTVSDNSMEITAGPDGSIPVWDASGNLSGHASADYAGMLAILTGLVTGITAFWLVVLQSASSAAAWLALSVTGRVTSRAQMKALPSTLVGATVRLDEGKRSGDFRMYAGAPPLADTREGIYVVSNTANFYWARVRNLSSVLLSWFDPAADGVTVDDVPIAGARAVSKVVVFDEAKYAIATTLTIARDGEKWIGGGGLIDGAINHYNNDLAGALTRVGTRLIWAGAAAGTMIRAQPYQSGANWFNGFGFSMKDLVIDCAEIANTGYQSLSHCFQSHENVTITRYKLAGWDMGVSANLSLGTSDSNGNLFKNCWAINRGSGAACINGIGWWFWGDGGTTGVTIPRGNFCESLFIGGGSYPHLSNPIAVQCEYMDTTNFFGFKWSGKLVVNAWDTGLRGLSDGIATPGQNSQCLSCNWYGYGGLFAVVASIAHPNDYGFNPFAHIAYGTPFGNIQLGPLIEASPQIGFRTDMTAGPSVLEPSKGPVSYGSNVPMVQVYRATNQPIGNAAPTAISWSDTLNDPLDCFVITNPTEIIVPNGVHKARVSPHVLWAGSAVGTRSVTIFLNGVATSYTQTAAGLAGGNEQFLAARRWLDVKGGDRIGIIVLQDSGGALNLVANVNFPIPHCEVEFI